MENSLKGLLLAAGTVITCIIIGLGFYISREARDTATKAAGQISKLNAEFSESDKIMYDSMAVSGTEVVNCINKFKNDEIGIIVNTKSTKDVQYNRTLSASGTADKQVYKLGGKSTNSVNNAQDVNHANHINPNGRFQGKILRDDNDVIVGIMFTQTN